MRALTFGAMVAAVFVLPATRVHAQAAPSDVRLRAGDAVRIEIKYEPNLSGEFPVGADGAILLPTLGSQPVAGRSFDDVERALKQAYSAELRDPEIRITPLLRVAVLGEVRVPGVFLIDPTFSVADILARAGGLTPFASENSITIKRPSGEVVGRFSLGAAVQQPPISSGDQILVGRRSWASQNLGIFLSAAGSVAVALITAVLVR
ncbi:MAG TPA: polysaccharide biosynthesis/export family protein [Longimicrobiales bacterium]|nr:polysaccharide biosynthesis/export family protein [Longimicrobiales bacterium]